MHGIAVEILHFMQNEFKLEIICCLCYTDERMKRVKKLQKHIQKIKILPNSLNFFVPEHICLLIADLVEQDGNYEKNVLKQKKLRFSHYLVSSCGIKILTF